jgi:hydrogenase expression/formation protein HypC
MCLAVPMKIVKLTGTDAVVELGGVQRPVNLTLISDSEIKTGDYVIVHAGFAIQKLDNADAEERLKLLQEMLELS